MFTLTGTLQDHAAAALAGVELTFTPRPAVTRDPDADVVYASGDGVPVTTDSAGSFTVDLVSADGLSYLAQGVPIRAFHFDAPADGETVNWADIMPLQATSPLADYVRGVGVPEGGTTGQALTKATDADFETEWTDTGTGTGGGSGGGGAELTSYSQVSSLADYPATFPPDLTGVTAADVGALPDTTAIPDAPADIGAATAAQGALADTAVQPADLGPYALDSDIPTTAAEVGALPDSTPIPDSPADIGAQPAGDYLTNADLPDLSGYATDSELSTGLAGKADTGHSHTISDTTGLQSALDGKQPSGSYATSAQGALADTAVQPADITGMVTGDGITQIVALTQAAYDALTPVATTLYVITDA